MEIQKPKPQKQKTQTSAGWSLRLQKNEKRDKGGTLSLRIRKNNWKNKNWIPAVVYPWEIRGRNDKKARERD